MPAQAIQGLITVDSDSPRAPLLWGTVPTDRRQRGHHMGGLSTGGGGGGGPDTNDYVDSFVAGVLGSDLTMTLGRTGALADLTQTVATPRWRRQSPG